MYVPDPSSSLPGAAENFKGCTLVFPCVSVGNVGQLACDLLVNTLKLSRVGYLRHAGLLPLVGNDAYDGVKEEKGRGMGLGCLHTSAEVYFRSEMKLAVVQIRAPIAKGHQRSVSQALLEWAKEAMFSGVVVLTSSYAYERKDSQIVGSSFRFLLNSKSLHLLNHFTEELQWKSLEPRKSGTETSPPPSDTSEAKCLASDEIFLPGAGIAKRLYTESEGAGVEVTVLLMFCSQGENVGDALEMASHLDQWLHLTPSQEEANWIQPRSWGLMFGGRFKSELF